MDDGSAILLLALLLGSAYFSASETAFFSLSRLYLKKLENNHTAGSRRILGLLRKPRRLLITLLLGNTFVNMAISSFATLLALGLAKKHGWEPSGTVTVQIIITTGVILLFGEIVPKLVALATADTIAQASSLPMRAIQFVLFPVVWIFEKISTLVSRRQAVDRYLGQRFTTEEFHNLIQSESSHHDLEDHEKRMLVGLFRFREAEISEIMVPRVKIAAIDASASMDEMKDLIVSSGYSRIPVYRESVDDIIGIVYVKDILLHPEKEGIADVMRPVWFVTENMKVQTLLNQFKSRKTQMAVVVDEYGGTAGIITLEDILEEIVGEIHDEFDKEEAPEIVKLDEHTYTVSGRCNIRQFNHEFSTELDTDEYDNLAEYLLAHFNHVPETGESYRLEDSMEFRVMESDGKSIKSIRVTVLEHE